MVDISFSQARRLASYDSLPARGVERVGQARREPRW